MKKYLVLEDGSVYEGQGFGSNRESIGELIFQTGMCGYQEIISDVAYYGQIVMMTYPAVGNVGINRDDFESMNPELFGLVVREYNEFYSNFRGDMSLDSYMKLKDIPGISGVDTREITRKLRDNGIMKAAIVDNVDNLDNVLNNLKNSDNLTDGVSKVSTAKSYTVPSRQGIKVVLLDLGVKYGVIRELNERGCEIVVMPYDTSADDILSIAPDGVIISSGPGRVNYIERTIETIREISDKVAILGLGLGYQVLAAAFGCEIEEMKFGSHGNSCPVVNLESNRVEFTAQNSRFTINRSSLEKSDLIETYKALNDDSVQGIKHKKLDVIGVQFLPEASPGADDTKYIFDNFVDLIKGGK